ncbi:hypothetical protein F485_gp111 [Aeromonas phage CC2]|uniref:Uncharacterized protein n=1 Tax=Aeromonas phage CC2 TaxID=1204516 RepID=I6XLJ7_9CAUD|nr:hypothetical protein F485_gp111 [Aeromonas phage CC2]AFN39374.1 hypothetical protein CC2_192 [Aeromonas phage CC2]
MGKIFEVIFGEVGTGKTSRLLAKAAEQVAISPVIVLIDELDEQQAFERLYDFVSPDTETFELVVSSVQSGSNFNGPLGLKEQLEKALVTVPDATHVFIDVNGYIPSQVIDIIGERELIVTKQLIRGPSSL